MPVLEWHTAERGVRVVNEIESLQAQCKELRFALDREIGENRKNGAMYEEKCEEVRQLEKRIEFLLGAIEAYKYCVDNIRR